MQSQMQSPLAVLDRDGVINRESAEFVKSAEEWQALPGSLDAVARLHGAGWTVVVATNQSGLARRKFSYRDLAAMHAKLERALATRGARIDGIFFCPHGPDDGCGCRKPLSGLYDQISRHLHRSVEGAVCIGDSMRDLTAATAAGGIPILVRTGNGRKTEEQLTPGHDIPVYDDLRSAVDALLRA